MTETYNNAIVPATVDQYFGVKSDASSYGSNDVKSLQELVLNSQPVVGTQSCFATAQMTAFRVICLQMNPSQILLQ
jgi:hypothetical protein